MNLFSNFKPTMSDIRNFFGGTNKKKTPSVPASSPSKTENSTVKKIEDSPTNTSKIVGDPTEQVPVEETAKSNLVNNQVKKKKKLIVDDDDEDEDEVDLSISTLIDSEKIKTERPSEKETETETKTITKTKLEPQIAKVKKSEVPREVLDIITWSHGTPVPYLALVETFEAISRVSGRLDKEGLFTRLFRAVILSTPLDLEAIIYLASNQVSPAYEGLELGIGDSLLVKAVCEATGRKKDAVEEAYEREGDLGTVALSSRAQQKTLSFAAKPKPLMAGYVLEQFRLITRTKGEKAQGRKVDIIKAMMIRCQGNEAKYIVRGLQGKLRIGTAAQTVLVGLAHAILQSSPPCVEYYFGGNGKMPSNKSGKEIEDVDGGDGLGEEDVDGGEDRDKKTPVEAKATRDGIGLLIGDGDPMSGGEEGKGFEKAQTPEVSVPTDGKEGKGEGGGEMSEMSRSHGDIEDENEEREKSELDLESLLKIVEEREPPEARTLREGKLKGSFASLTLDSKKDLSVQVVKRAFSECPNYSLIVQSLLSRPLHEIHRFCRLIPGVPVSPMLAKPTKEVREVLKRLSGMAFTMEYKYDGERGQIHLLPKIEDPDHPHPTQPSSSTSVSSQPHAAQQHLVKIFSRNSEDNTEKYPDLMDVIRRVKHPLVTSCVIDSEVVAFDREKCCLLPFQVLSTRKRKVEEGESADEKVKVVLQAFDLLYLNGKSLLQLPLRQRRQLLHAAFREETGYFYFAGGMDHVEDGDTTPIESFMTEACGAMCEGLMVKTLDDNASYEASKRSLNWLKLKKDYIDGMGICDSVDLVVIGGYMGRGKRTNVYGAYLMACYDPDRDEFQSVCKVGTGFKDEELVRFTELMSKKVLPSKRKPSNYNVGDPLEPDDWFDASVVWELQAADLSKSTVHKGAIGRVDSSGSRGIGLRFPRFIRERPDKKPEFATAAEQIADMYFSQDGTGGGGTEEGAEEGEDDFI